MKTTAKILVAVILTLWMGVSVVYIIGEPDYTCTLAAVLLMKGGGLASAVICGLIARALIRSGWYDIAELTRED